MTGLNELAKEIHQNAVAHGWYDQDRSFGDILVLCHSELSEALEEYRAKRPMAYAMKKTCAECPDYPNGGQYMETRVEQWEPGDKPEGIAVEMADCVIRVLDWFGSVGIDPEEIILRKHEYNKTRPYRHGGKAL